MDFDINDPLGDILSDDSNDSFFNDKFKNSPKVKTQSTKKSDLFGLENDVREETSQTIIPKVVPKEKPQDDWLGLNESKNITPVAKKKDVEIKSIISNINPQKYSENVENVQQIKPKSFSDALSFLDKLDVLNKNVDIESDAKIKKDSLNLDDLLGPTKPSVNKLNVKSESKSVHLVNPTNKKEISSNFRRKIINKDNERSSKQYDQLKLSSNTDKQENKDMKTSKRQKSDDDWLGLLSSANDSFEKEETLANLLIETEKKEKPAALPSKNDIKYIETPPQENITLTEVKQNVDKKNDDKTLDISVNKVDHFIAEMDHSLKMTNNPVLSLTNNVDIEQQCATVFLQQQESHLLVALQMKAQEEKLAAMQERQEDSRRVQHEVMSAHREQLNNILERQSNHRTQLQNIISQHQQRINKHIEELLKPSQSLADENNLNPEGHNNRNYNMTTDENEIKNLIGKKYQVEEVVSILKENYEREIELIENSYKRQLEYLNESIINIERRNKIENEKLSQYYLTEIEKLEQDKIKITKYFENYIKLITTKEAEERDRIEKKHLSDIEILQNQHYAIVNNIKNAVDLEHTTLKDTSEYSQKLNSIVIDIEKNSKMCTDVMDKLENLTNKNLNEKSDILKTKEDYLNRILENIEKQSKVYEIQSNETKSILQILEQKLKQQTLEMEEEKHKMKQKEMTLMEEKEIMKLEFEQMSKKLQNEKDVFMRSTIEFTKQNSDQNVHIEEQMKKIEIELNLLKNEKKNVQESKFELQTLKSKLDDELQELSNNKKNLQLEQEKLYQNELKLFERSKDLEVLTKNALEKQKNAESKYYEASYAQQIYEEKLIAIQEQSLSLNAREQHLAKEKVSMSRERLLLYNQRTGNENTICNACRMSKTYQRFNDNKQKDVDHSYNRILEQEYFSSSHKNNNAPKLSFLDKNLNNKELKEIKDSLNHLGRGEKNPDFGFMDTILTKTQDNKESISMKFQEIVDPNILALKFNIFETSSI